MRRDALQFAQQDANNLRAFGNFEIEQFFRRHHIGEIVAERIEIIHPVGDDDALLIFFVLEKLLHPRVQIADVGNGFDDQFAVKPSSSRRTPCVEGCCGPIESVICDSSDWSRTSNWLGNIFYCNAHKSFIGVIDIRRFN